MFYSRGRLGIDPVELNDLSDSEGSSEDESFQESEMPTLGGSVCSEQPGDRSGSKASEFNWMLLLLC